MSDSLKKDVGSESLDAPKFATKEEIEVGKKGVDSFKGVFRRTSLSARPFLLFGEQAACTQALFLGLKAMTQFGHKRPNFPLPEGMIDHGKHLINIPVATKILNENNGASDAFFDYDPNTTTPEDYMKNLIDWENKNQSPGVVLRVGLMYGDPKDAVLDFTKYNQAQKAVVRDAIFSYRHSKDVLPPDELEILRNLAGFDKKGVLKEDSSLDNLRYEFMKAHEDEVRKYLAERRNLTTEAVDFIIGSFKPVKVRGFAYKPGRCSEDTLRHPQKVEEVFERSGMNNFLKSAKKFGMFMR